MIIKETPTYKLPTPGSVQGVLAEVVDLGMITSDFYGTTNQKVLLCFEITETVEREGQQVRMIVSRRFTASLNEKAALRKFLEGWRGRAFTDEELGGFDLDSIIGANAILSLVHQKDGDKTYCNIDSAAALLKGMERILISPDYLPYAARMAKRNAAGASAGGTEHAEPGSYEATADDIPF